MGNRLCSVLLLVLMVMLSFNQSDLTTSHPKLSELDEPIISAINHMSDITAAHITTPPTLPTNKIHIDTVLPVTEEVTCSVIPVVEQYNFVSHKTESDGFIDIKKYQSSYLS